MNIPIIDKSNYLKGLFITAKLGGKLNPKGREILKTISEKLGFSKDFYEETSRNLLRNKYIIQEKIKFSSKEIAKLFIKDAFNLALSNDDSLNENQINWLNEISDLNEIFSPFAEMDVNELKSQIDSTTI